MPAIQSVMKRLGFVKLRDYGLVLTPEGRILSIRPAVLDDGLGGRIVGWKDDDLAAMELDRWSELGRAMAAKPAALPAVATPVAVRPIAPLPRPAAPPPVPAAPGRPLAAPNAPKVSVVAPAVASERVVEEDDWEWTIAIARARAAAEEAELAVAPPPSRAVRPVPPAAMAMVKSAANATAAAAVIATTPVAAKPVTRDTQPLDDFDVSDHTSPTIVRAPVAETVPSIATKPAFVKATTIVDSPTPSLAKTTPIAKVAAPITTAPVPPPLQIPTPPQPLPIVKIPVAAPNRSFARGQSPATVIPIPRMPRVEPGKLAPVVAVRPSTRFAKGTGPVIPPVISTTVVPSNDDKTLPSLLLPSVSRSASR